jgi:hemolysin D
MANPKPADAPNVVPLRHGEPARRGAELEFLPAALEIVETPASPAGRTIAATIMLFFALAIAWACFSRIDIIATATGKIVPTGRVKVIQPFEIGVVRAIHVQDGQAVKAGDVLIELDPTIDQAERDHVAKDLMAAQLDSARLRATLAADGGPDPAPSFVPPPDASPDQMEVQQNLLDNAVKEIRAKLANLDRQIAEDTANRDAVAATEEKLSVVLPLLQKRADAFKTLYDEGYGSMVQYLQTQQDLLEHEQELRVQKARFAEASEKLAADTEQRGQTDAEFRRTNFGDLSQAEAKAAGLHEDLVKAEEHANLQTLTAPVDGTVQQLAVHTVGGVVTPAQQLLIIVPSDSHLEIEAMVPNKDIGFVHEGENAEIKVDTFNFTKYGLLHGEVLSISQDAISRDTPPDKAGSDSKPQQGASSDSSEPKGQELVYAARISLDREQMQVDDKMVNLEPGMAVTAEIKTGSRRVIEYLMSPLLRYKQDALKER